jgi:hypothetical protein
MKRIYANEPTRWQRYSHFLMSTLTKLTNRSHRHKGRWTKHIFDWMAHSHNLSKGVHSRCRFCGLLETQQHINVSCTHPRLVEIRMVHRKHFDLYFQCYRHEHLSPPTRWLIQLLDYIEDNLWSDSEGGGDIWNGRWTPCLLDSILTVPADYQITPR